MKSKLLIVLFLIFAFVGLTFCYFLLSSHPSDKTMETFFSKNEKDFEKLRLMFDEDSNCATISYNENLPMIDYSKAEPRAVCRISEERQNEYRGLFKKLGIYTLISREFNRPDLMTFTTSFESGEKLANGETGFTEKGYIYSPRELSPLANSLDNSNETAYKKIKENWYLYYKTGILKPE
jgi:hypothetical protein